jgi:hypothetical protein
MYGPLTAMLDCLARTYRCAGTELAIARAMRQVTEFPLVVRFEAPATTVIKRRGDLVQLECAYEGDEQAFITDLWETIDGLADLDADENRVLQAS